MKRIAALLGAVLFGLCPGSAQTVDVGAGAPNDYIRNQFVAAFNRGSFPRLAQLPPAGAVRKFGSTGLVQEFTDASQATLKLALVKATSEADPQNPNGDVRQVLTDVYTYYTSVGVGTAGYPTADTQSCPAIACTWQPFDKNYLLFAYSAGANTVTNVTVRDPFYTRWILLGGISGLGPALTAESNVASPLATSAVMQTFVNGALFSITSGAQSGKVISVRQPVYDLFVKQGGPAGSLGLPLAEEQVAAGGKHSQAFEGGTIEYTDGSTPVVRTPVSNVTLQPGTTPVRLNTGDTLSLTAVVYGSDGSQLTDRVVNFTTSNGRVVSIQSSGLTAVLRAVGGGTARITAISEGKTSAPIDIIVTAQCCAVGEGAPSTAIQQAFNDAVARTRVQLRTPGPERVRRAGNGYVQEFQGTDPASNSRYLIAISDHSAQAFIVSGALLGRYEQAGASAGVLGFPISDATATGRQAFENGMLAGTPVRIVSGAILTRWAQSGYEAGPPGSPVAEASEGTSFTTATGRYQAFAGGAIVSGLKGAFFLRTPVAQKYSALGGITSALGLPVAEETAAGNLRHQEFEGGYLEYAGASSDVSTVLRDRQPTISSSPSTVLPGSRVHLAVWGFRDGASIRVSVTGQPDFVISTANGAYSWDTAIPSGAAAGMIAVRAVDTSTGAAASGSLTIRSLAAARVQLSIASGDGQSGAPGTQLTSPLRIVLKDESSSPMAGVTIRFTASPGATAVPDAVVTDTTGVAETRLQLPATEGIALVTAEAAGKIVTFSARSAGAAISSFPKLTASGSELLGNGNVTIADGGALLTAAASLIRYGQMRGDFKSPNGLAEPSVLNSFLKRTCATDSQGQQVCDGFYTVPESGEQVLNLWRLSAFTGGGLTVSVENPDPVSVRTLVAGGSPVLLALNLSSGGQPAGAHFVVATGVGSDGTLQIQDPSATFSRTSLGDYLNGFTVGSQSWKGQITGAVRFLPQAPLSTSFVVSSMSPVNLTSGTGPCGTLLQWPIGTAGRTFYQRPCEGSAAEYQLDVTGDGPFSASVLDLAESGTRADLAGSSGAAFRITRPGSYLVINSQETMLAVNGILNSASYTSDLSPGTLISIFGSGLSRSGTISKVLVDGRSAPVLSASPFQINAQIPADLGTGGHVLRLETPFGAVEQSIDLRMVAPAIFRIGSTSKGVVVNQDGSLNSVSNPARRGETVVIYATGLGVTTQNGSLNPVRTAVTVRLSAQDLRPSYAGLTPGFLGLYQVNVAIPAGTPPGLTLNLTVRQAEQESLPVEISLL